MLYKVLSLPCDWGTYGSYMGLGHTEPGREPKHAKACATLFVDSGWRVWNVQVVRLDMTSQWAGSRRKL